MCIMKKFTCNNSCIKTSPGHVKHSAHVISDVYIHPDVFIVSMGTWISALTDMSERTRRTKSSLPSF